MRYSKPLNQLIKPLESQIQLAILHYLKTIGAYAGKTKMQGTARLNKYKRQYYSVDPYNLRGFPDITGFYRGKIFFVEVKRPGGRQSDSQKIFQEYCIQSGIDYILAYDVRDVEEAIKNMIRG